MPLMAHSVDSIPARASPKTLHQTTTRKASQALALLDAGGLLLLPRLLLEGMVLSVMLLQGPLDCVLLKLLVQKGSTG